MQHHTKRPPRLPQLFPELLPLFFVTIVTHQRQAILDTPAIHLVFRTFCTKAPSHGISVGRYVLMPDHLHLFLWVNRESIGMGPWVRMLKRTLSPVLKAHDHEMPHWQSGFFDHLLRSNESYTSKSEYVSHNPVRQGLCHRAEEWPYGGTIAEINWTPYGRAM